ncbi:MAG: LysR family transcriptional regulator [Magnetovibrio sp.]|nr:LysR family transcriptional regulator [Magnetovibrio sp.]
MTPPLPDVGLKHLNAIVSLARFGSFIAAANYLGISQPGLTRIIQQSERKLGTQLFQRGPRSVSLTAAGHDFLPFAERMIGEFAAQTERLRASHGAPEARLTISSLMSVSHIVLPAALVEFRRTYPQVFVEIREGVGSAIHEDVRNGLVDFGIGNPEEQPPGLSVESVMEEAFFAVLPKRHPLADREVLQFLDLKDTALISMPVESGLRRIIDGAAAKAGIGLTHGVVTKQYSSLFSFVANGLGVTLVPASVLPPAGEGGLVVRPLAPTITRQIGVMHLEDRPLNAVSEAFLRTLRPLLVNATGGARTFAIRPAPE